MNERLYADVTIPPGEHLADTLRELDMSQSELARKMGRPVQAINQIVNGSKAITAETALQIEEATGVPAHIWTRLEADYRLTVARLQTQKRTPVRAGRLDISGFAAFSRGRVQKASAKKGAGKGRR